MSDITIDVPVLTVREGSYYRNTIGVLVRIVGFVDPMSPEYARGFRFFDQRGTCYGDDGSVFSRLWKSLNLVELVQPHNVTDEEIETIAAQWARFMRLEAAKMKVGSVFSAAKNWTIALMPVAVFGVAANATFRTLRYADSMYRRG